MPTKKNLDERINQCGLWKEMCDPERNVQSQQQNKSRRFNLHVFKNRTEPVDLS